MAPSEATMWLFVSLLCLLAKTTLSATAEGPSSGEGEWLSSLVELIEMEYEDQCSLVAEAKWALLERRKNALEEKLDADKAFGHFAKSQVYEVKNEDTNGVKDVLLKRKIDLISKPGDTILETDQWNTLVSFADMATHDIETTTTIDCKQSQPQDCTYSEFLSVLASSRDRHLLTSAKTSWETKLPDEHKFATDILPLVKNASRVNGYEKVEEYWEMLSEYEGGYSKSQELWEEVKPLYERLHKYLAQRLQQNNGSIRDDGSIPAHWLGSIFGDDWSNVADIALPDLTIYNEINKNLLQKFIGGRNAYKTANSLLQRLGLEDLKSTFWRDSKFDKTCPARLVHFCGRETVTYVFTCKDISLPLLLDAHDKVMSVKHAEVKLQSRSNSYIIREANRYSALDVALSEMGSLLALNAHQLDAEEVLPLKVSQSAKNQANTKLAFQMMAALKDLPRLAYYLAADSWRLNLLKSNGPINIGSSWAYARRNISKVSPSDRDYLGDSNILSNRPYLHKFFGVLLKYQLFDSLSEEMYGEIDGDIVKHIAEGSPKIKDLMSKGYSQAWPQTIKDTLNIKDINNEALLDYFQTLNDFLSSELDEPEIKDKEEEEEEDGEVNYEDEDAEKENVEESAPEEEPNDNTMDVSESAKQLEATPEPEIAIEKDIVKSQSHPPVEDEKEEENELAYVSNPHLISKDESSPAASSSDNSVSNGDSAESAPQQSKLPYAWIALGVLVVIIAVLAVVIGRKRYKHKKELERERREGAA